MNEIVNHLKLIQINIYKYQGNFAHLFNITLIIRSATKIVNACLLYYFK